jgi:hypothetical protein
MVRVVVGLLVAGLILCGCWGEPPTRPSPSTRPLPSTRPSFPPTTIRPPGEEVIGLCLANPRPKPGEIVQGEFIRCAVKPRPGFGSPGEIVGVTTVRIDRAEGEPPFGSDCSVATDALVRARLPSGEIALLCLDLVPAYGNSRS